MSARATMPNGLTGTGEEYWSAVVEFRSVRPRTTPEADAHFDVLDATEPALTVQDRAILRASLGLTFADLADTSEKLR